MRKKYLALTTGVVSLALIGNGAYDVYADGDLAPSADSVTPPQYQEAQEPEKPVPEQKRETPPVQLPPKEDTAPPAPPVEQKPEPKSEPQPEQKPETPPTQVPPNNTTPSKKSQQSESEVSEPSKAFKAETKSQPDNSSSHKEDKTDNKVVASTTKEKSVIASNKKLEESKEEKSTNSNEKKTSDTKEEEVKGEKMAKTGFSPLPFAQMIGGLFGLGGTALYGIRRKK